MTDRRANQVLDEWRELERRVSDGDLAPGERDRLVRLISELRAEYQRLTVRDLPAGGSLPHGSVDDPGGEVNREESAQRA